MKGSRRWGALATVCVVGAVWCGEASGQARRANYDGVLLGERSTGLGGAYTAVADDAAAFYYNPAGLVQIPRSGLSLSANTYGYRRSVAQGALSSPSESKDLVEEGLQIFPNSVVYVLPLGIRRKGGLRHAVALGFMVPLAYSYEGSQNLSLPEAGDSSDVYTAIDEVTYQAGAAYSLRLGPVMFGASVLALYANLSEQEHYIETLSDSESADRYQSFSNTNATYLGLTGDFGALWYPGGEVGDGFSVGLKVGFPAGKLWSNASVSAGESASSISRDFDDPDKLVVDELYQDVYRELAGTSTLRRPWQFSLGAAWRAPSGLLFSSDVRLYLPTEEYALVGGTLQEPNRSSLELSDEFTDLIRGIDLRIFEPEHGLVINGALGASIPVTEEYALLAGAFTDFSAITDAVYEETGVDQIDRFGATLGVRKGDDSHTLTIATVGRYGAGRSPGFAYDGDGFPDDYDAELVEWSVTLVVAGTAVLGDDEEEALPPAGDGATEASEASDGR